MTRPKKQVNVVDIYLKPVKYRLFLLHGVACAQRKLAEAQTRMLRKQQYQLAQKPLMFDPGPQQGAASRLFGDKDWYQKIQQ